VTKLPPGDVTGVTVLLLTCAYRGAEFLRVGYYVNTEYWDPALREDPPATVQIDKLSRSILADKPRVTRFPADFDDDGAGGAGGAVSAAVPGAAPAADAFDGGAAGFGAAPPGDDGAAAFAAAYGAPPPAPAFEGAAAVGGEGDVAMDG
jgi:histone chaperone ASF1